MVKKLNFGYNLSVELNVGTTYWLPQQYAYIQSTADCNLLQKVQFFISYETVWTQSKKSNDDKVGLHCSLLLVPPDFPKTLKRNSNKSFLYTTARTTTVLIPECLLFVFCAPSSFNIMYPRNPNQPKKFQSILEHGCPQNTL